MARLCTKAFWEREKMNFNLLNRIAQKWLGGVVWQNRNSAALLK